MSQSYVLSSNFITLTNIYENLTPEQLKIRNPTSYDILVKNPYTLQAYKIWISLSEEQRQLIRDNIENGTGTSVLTLSIDNVIDVSYPEVLQMLAQNKLNSYRKLDDEYVLFTGKDNTNYVVNAKIDPNTNSLVQIK